MFQTIYTFITTIIFYTTGTLLVGSSTNAPVAPTRDATGIYWTVSAKDSAGTARWDTLNFYASSKAPTSTSINFSSWVGSATRIDSMKVYINGVFQQKVLCKTTEAEGQYAFTFTSQPLYPANLFRLVYHVKTGGTSATTIKIRPKLMLQ